MCLARCIFVHLKPCQVPAFTQFGKLALFASVVTLYATAVYLGQILVHGQYVAGHFNFNFNFLRLHSKAGLTTASNASSRPMTDASLGKLRYGWPGLT